MKEAEKTWILVGHQIFAEKGPAALKVEVIAREANKNKSSFYHHFVDMEMFKTRLIEYHTSRAKVIIEEEKKCQNIDPDLISVMMKYRKDVLFHRQLLINRHIPEYEEAYARTTAQGVDAILKIWNKELNLVAYSSLGRRLLEIGLENLFQQSLPKNLDSRKLANSFQDLKLVAAELRNSRVADGSV